MAGSSPLTRITSGIIQELDDSSNNIAAQMKAEIIDPEDVQNKQRYLDYVDRQWDDPKFRQDLHQQVGDQHLISIAKDVLSRRAAKSAEQPASVGAAAQSAGQIAALTPPAAPPMAPPLPPPSMPMPPPAPPMPLPPPPIPAPPGLPGVLPGAPIPPIIPR